MFDTKIKAIGASFALALILGAGPIGCSGTTSALTDGSKQYTMMKRSGDLTLSAVDQTMLAHLDGIKLVSGRGPKADNTTKFDVALEVQGVGVQLGQDRTYGYMRADRAFTNDHRVGVRFRFQF
jgi:hypothetical protein